ncbi:hypothetical protein ACTFIW_003645 [Dictyostelium discoideum]
MKFTMVGIQVNDTTRSFHNVQGNVTIVQLSRAFIKNMSQLNPSSNMLHMLRHNPDSKNLHHRLVSDFSIPLTSDTVRIEAEAINKFYSVLESSSQRILGVPTFINKTAAIASKFEISNELVVIILGHPYLGSVGSQETRSQRPSRPTYLPPSRKGYDFEIQLKDDTTAPKSRCYPVPL